MTTTVFHPATIRLLRLQSRGRGRRMWARFRQKRRLVLSAVACVLAVVWLGNAAMTVWLRETASPETLRALLSVGLVLYAGWHLAKAAFARPESPFDWTTAERDLLAAMPLRPRDLVGYQLASVTVTTFLKTLLFTVLLLPDLRCVPLAVIGLLLVMMVLEMLRMGIEIATWGMGRSAFLAYRASVVAGLVVGGFAVGAVILRENAFAGRIDVGEGLRQRILDITVRLNDSAFGYAALPFQPFVDLIVADRMTTAKAGLAAAAFGTVTALAAALIALYTVTSRRVAERERRNYRPNGAARGVIANSTQNETAPAIGPHLIPRLRHLPHCGGAGALALAATGRRPPSLGEPVDGDDRAGGLRRCPLLRDRGPPRRVPGSHVHAGVLYVPAVADRAPF